MFKRILVPIDFSAPSDRALDSARLLAERFGATLHLLHVTMNPFLHAFVGDPRDLEEASRQRLQDRLTAAEIRSGATAAVERSDEPASEIVTYARDAGVDLIVMATHGRTGLPHALLGSVAERVVRHAPCAVLTLRDVTVAAHATGDRHVQQDSRSH